MRYAATQERRRRENDRAMMALEDSAAAHAQREAALRAQAEHIALLEGEVQALQRQMATLAKKYEDGWKSIDSREKKLKEDVENFRYSSNKEAQSKSRSSALDSRDLRESMPGQAAYSGQEGRGSQPSRTGLDPEARTGQESASAGAASRANSTVRVGSHPRGSKEDVEDDEELVYIEVNHTQRAVAVQPTGSLSERGEEEKEPTRHGVEQPVSVGRPLENRQAEQEDGSLARKLRVHRGVQVDLLPASQ